MLDKLIALFVDRGHKGSEIVEEVKEILALIDAQRCVCIYDDDERILSTGCGKDLYYDAPFDVEYSPYCPCCGKKIEMMEG